MPSNSTSRSDDRCLVVVGTGIEAVGHMTLAAKAEIEAADLVLYLVSNPVAEGYIQRLNSNHRSLSGHYQDGKDRFESYQEMIAAMLSSLDEAERVCAVFYGHPGVFAFPAHEAIRKARKLGHTARMLPGVSAEDCLFADLGIDPCSAGCQSFEATDFLLHGRNYDANSALIIWQIGMIGDMTFQSKGYESPGLDVLCDRLKKVFPEDHVVVVYEAAIYPIMDHKDARHRLCDLPKAEVTSTSTLYVPPRGVPEMDMSIANAIGLDPAKIPTVVVEL
eukprot:g1473.t1